MEECDYLAEFPFFNSSFLACSNINIPCSPFSAAERRAANIQKEVKKRGIFSSLPDLEEVEDEKDTENSSEPNLTRDLVLLFYLSS